MQNTPKDILYEIRKAKEQQLKELNLGWSELTKIPNEVFELENLETLFLNNNQISTIPDSITRLQKLTKLGLSRNRISQIEREGVDYLFFIIG